MEGAKGVQGASSLHLPDSKRCFWDRAFILLLEMSLGRESIKCIPEQWGSERWPGGVWWQQCHRQQHEAEADNSHFFSTAAPDEPWLAFLSTFLLKTYLGSPTLAFPVYSQHPLECPVPVPRDFNFFRFLWLFPALSQKLNLVRGKYSVSTCRMCAQVSEGSPSFRVIAIWMSRGRILCEVNGVIVVFYYIVLHSVSLLILSKTIP